VSYLTLCAGAHDDETRSIAMTLLALPKEERGHLVKQLPQNKQVCFESEIPLKTNLQGKHFCVRY
jgi:hypothetical protein